jgi:hypothetical protein
MQSALVSKIKIKSQEGNKLMMYVHDLEKFNLDH